MFLHERTILYPVADELRAATGDTRTGIVLRSNYFSLESEGFPAAFPLVRKEHFAPVRFIIPEEYLYLTQVTLETKSTIRSEIAAAIKDVFPESLSEIAWDFEILSEKEGQTVIEISGVTKEFGELLTAALSHSGLRLEAIIPESYALARTLPFDEPVILIHKRDDRVILCLSRKQKVVSTIILDHQPTPLEVREFIEFGKTRKGCAVEKIVLSGFGSEEESLGVDDLPVSMLDTALDPIHGALLLDYSSRHDADRLDLPLRIRSGSWYQRVLNLFR
ncbi:MAG: hypothetical protein ACEQSB_04675 [Undibacterium sp.]